MAKGSRVWRVVRNIVEAVVAAILFSFQYIPNPFFWGAMLMPVAVYVGYILRADPDFLRIGLYPFMPFPSIDWACILAGLILFVGALGHILLRRGRLVTSGLYAAVRHPQYLGLILITLGLSLLSLRRPRAPHIVLEAWLLQVVGYVLLAMFEERHLLHEFGDDYEAYRQRVSFLLPVSRLVRLPEPFFSLLTVLVVALLLLVLWNCLYFRSL